MNSPESASLHKLDKERDVEGREWREFKFKDIYPAPRYFHSMCYYKGYIYCLGGCSFRDTQLNDFHRFNVETKCWEQLKSSVISERYGASILPYEDKLYLFGGKTYDDNLNDFWEYDLKTEKWAKLNSDGEIPSPRRGHRVCIYRDMMLLQGGFDDERRFSEIHIYHFSTNKWTVLNIEGDSPMDRSYHVFFVHDDQIFMGTGRGGSYLFLGDWWTLKLPNLKDSNSMGVWKELNFKEKPDCRYGTAYVYNNGFLHMYAGHGSEDGEFPTRDYEDVWRLNLSNLTFSKLPDLKFKSFPLSSAEGCLVENEWYLFGGNKNNNGVGGCFDIFNFGYVPLKGHWRQGLHNTFPRSFKNFVQCLLLMHKAKNTKNLFSLLPKPIMIIIIRYSSQVVN